MTNSLPSFAQLGLGDKLLQALSRVGYETPTPIQAKGIPPLLNGRDVLGQAQTGTGKTAAFALPLLQMIDVPRGGPQVLVLAPTRELAIQVAEAFQVYSHFMPAFHVLPVYGGQAYDKQIRALKRGVQVVVGTPGRVMDHMRKGTLKLDKLTHIVLDEADEMLRMGFIDDVEWVLGQAPPERQIALFSATMPKAIAKVAKKYLQNPEYVSIAVKSAGAETINQRYWPATGLHKLDALTRILEVESFDAMIIFVRTKTATVELAEKLEARGYSCAALNGDIAQNVRERTVDKLKRGQIDILIATDVAARGLDVERISHVLNYDIPYDPEAYVHRIGRTGRAGRSGEAILFVAKREMRMLRTIEKATGKVIPPMVLPSAAAINEQRLARFKEKVLGALSGDDLEPFKDLANSIVSSCDADAVEVAAALIKLYESDLLTKHVDQYHAEPRANRRDLEERPKGKKKPRGSDKNMNTYRIDVGHDDNVKPGAIVGAIANEADIDSQYIGQIKIYDNYSTVQLPKTLAAETLKTLQRVWVCQKQLKPKLIGGAEEHKTGAKSKSKKAVARSR